MRSARCFRADSESAHESGASVGSEGAKSKGKELQSAIRQSAQSFALGAREARYIGGPPRDNN
eukprot:7535046-Alexandrium_andersonii.AAC.1